MARTHTGRAGAIGIVAGLLCLTIGLRAFGLEGEVVVDAVPSASLAPTRGPGSPLVQAEATRITSQGALSGHVSPSDALSLSATAWALLDTLPTYNPQSVPTSHLALSSRLLQLDLTWQIIPGVLIWDTGKEIIHPSSGFFRTPLNLISRGPAGNVPQQTPSASPQWEEGWIGMKLLWIVGDVSLENFFSPRLKWSSDADTLLGHVSAQQDDFLDQLRIEAHVGGVDLQALGLFSTGGPGSADPGPHVQFGAGIDANIGDRLTVRGEVTLSDSLQRLAVVDPQLMTTSTQTVPWVVRALAGLTWSITTKASLLVEYYYDGLGFAGNAYANVMQYSESRQNQASSAPDVVGQFGSFAAAQHYAFIRWAEDITDQLTAQAWVQANLQDASGMDGIGIAMTNDRWGLSGSVTSTWGGNATEAGVSPFLWQLDVELKLFF